MDESGLCCDFLPDSYSHLGREIGKDLEISPRIGTLAGIEDFSS